MEVIKDQFPDLSSAQLKQFEQMKPLYEEWNSKINVISRKDMEHFYVHHVLHSLAICKLPLISENMRILDVGTGGGFPGIPLAICHPKAHFTLVDSIGKKIRVVKEVSDSLGLANVKAYQERMERIDEKFDLIVSRAVAPALTLIQWTAKSLKKQGMYAFIKGGDLSAEKNDVMEKYPKAEWREYQLSDWFSSPFFETKKLVVFRS